MLDLTPTTEIEEGGQDFFRWRGIVFESLSPTLWRASTRLDLLDKINLHRERWLWYTTAPCFTEKAISPYEALENLLATSLKRSQQNLSALKEFATRTSPEEEPVKPEEGPTWWDRL